MTEMILYKLLQKIFFYFYLIMEFYFLIVSGMQL